MFYVRTKWYRTLSFLAMFCMITAQCYQLLTYRTTAVRFPFTLFRMCDDTAHFRTRCQPTIGISTLRCMHQRLNASLNRLLTCFLRIGLLLVAGRRTVVQIETKFFHFVGMSNFSFASRTQIEILFATRKLIAIKNIDKTN